MSSRLPNYLKMHRKRAGFSQDEVAFVLGCQSGAKVSRYERMSRQPGLEAALAFRKLFGIPVEELFAGVSEKVEKQVLQRARQLRERLAAQTPDRLTQRKLERLDRLVAPAPALARPFDGPESHL